MEKFTASNGIAVEKDVHGCVSVGGINSLRDETQTLREFFQHERDQELGRWRSKEHPEYFGMADEGNYIGWFYNERTNHGFYADRDTNVRLYTAEEREVVAEYFGAHPEAKPWHDAKPGEVWLLTFLSGAQMIGLVDHDGECFISGVRELTVIESTAFAAGRRIWPEVE